MACFWLAHKAVGGCVYGEGAGPGGSCCGDAESRGDAASRGKPPQAVHSSCSLDALPLTCTKQVRNSHNWMIVNSNHRLSHIRVYGSM